MSEINERDRLAEKLYPADKPGWTSDFSLNENDLDLSLRAAFIKGWDAHIEHTRNDVHTCHNECPRIICVQERRIKDLEITTFLLTTALKKEIHDNTEQMNTINQIINALR